MAEPALIVRPAATGDGSILTTLLIAQLRGHDNRLSDAALGAAVDGMLWRPQRGQFLIARRGDVAVGFAALSYLWTLERGGRAAWLDELYVLPEWRSQGIGAALLGAAVEVAAAAGVRALDLEVESGHERAARLYQRAGLTPLSRQRWAMTLSPAASPPPPAPADLAGGCLCGGVRYRLDAAPLRISHCHCHMCRRAAGAPFVTWLTVARDALRFTVGSPRARRSSPHAVRTFCAECGTPVTFTADAHPESIDLTLGSLDDPEAVTPDEHIWTTSQLAWLRLDDDLPRYRGEGSD